MTKTLEKNYSEAQEARMLEFTEITSETATELAAEFGKNQKSVIAKAVRLGIYKAKETKSGAPIERKEQIVADIAKLVQANVEGLEKAPKQVLVALRAKLSA